MELSNLRLTAGEEKKMKEREFEVKVKELKDEIDLLKSTKDNMDREVVDLKEEIIREHVHHKEKLAKNKEELMNYYVEK